MEKHPIENLMDTAMQNIKNIIDVDTIIGEPMNISETTVIIPISKVSLGFAAGGSEFKNEVPKKRNKREEIEDVEYKLPFGGGSRGRFICKTNWIFNN